MVNGFGAKEKLMRTLVVALMGRNVVYKVHSHFESITLKFLWSIRVRE